VPFHCHATNHNYNLNTVLTLCRLVFRRIRFDVRLLQRVPYEGISRMSTSLRRRHRDRVVRRGIGLTIESDFYATEAGRAHFADQLTSIRYCVQEVSLTLARYTFVFVTPFQYSRLFFRVADLQLRRDLRLPYVRQLRLPL
jgi:hypothetical protein